MSSDTSSSKTLPSRLDYEQLEPRPGREQILVIDGDGIDALVRLTEAARAAGVDLTGRGRVLYAPDHRGVDRSPEIQALGFTDIHHETDRDALVARLRDLLRGAQMGQRVYAAGSDTLLALAVREVLDAGLPRDAIQTEHCGSTARRVQCVHCKGFTENVTVDPVRCSHCGLHLLVRDHYSRRLGAYQGVCIDAEDPGDVPQAEERFA